MSSYVQLSKFANFRDTLAETEAVQAEAVQAEAVLAEVQPQAQPPQAQVAALAEIEADIAAFMDMAQSSGNETWLAFGTILKKLLDNAAYVAQQLSEKANAADVARIEATVAALQVSHARHTVQIESIIGEIDSIRQTVDSIVDIHGPQLADALKRLGEVEDALRSIQPQSCAGAARTLMP
jgi:hypothetical protein